MATNAVYFRVDTKFWAHARRARWSTDATTLALYLLTCKHRHTEGLYELPLGYAAADTGLTLDQVDQALDDLVDDGFVEHDPAADLVLLPKALAYQAPSGGDQIVGAVRRLEELPDSPLLTRFAQVCAELCPDLWAALPDAWKTAAPAPPAETPPLDRPVTARSTAPEPTGDRPVSDRSSSQDSRLKLKTQAQNSTKPQPAEAARGDPAPTTPRRKPAQHPPQPFAADFDRLWHLYPRKVYRAKALRAFVALMRRADPPDRPALLDQLGQATGHYAAACTSRDPAHVMHGATWFGPDEPWRDWTAGNPEPAGNGSGRRDPFDALIAQAHAEQAAQ